MPIHSSWYITDHIILNTLHNDVTRDDIVQSVDVMLTMVNASHMDSVHILFDFNEAVQIPVNIPLWQQATLSLIEHPRTGWMIGTRVHTPLFAVLTSAVSQITGAPYRILPTYDTALAFLEAESKMDFGIKINAS